MSTASAVKLVQTDKLLRVLAFTLMISVMNATMFNVALPQISVEFALVPSQVSWIVTSYMIVYAIGTVIYGKLADKYRLKDLLTFGLIFFAFGSIAGLIANQFWLIVLGRVLQAAGSSVVTAAAMIIPVRYYSPEKRGRALGITAMGIAFGTAAGPIVSGVITSAASWRYLFLLSLLALIALPSFRRYLDDTKGAAKQADIVGGLLLGGTVAALLLALTGGGAWLLGGGVLFLIVLFVIRIRVTKEPFIQPTLFGNKRYVFGLVISFLSSSALFSIPFLTPLLLGKINAFTPLQIGVAMFPAAAIAAILGRQGGKIADHHGNGTLFYWAASLLALGFVLLSWTAGLFPLFIAGFLLFGSVGMTFMQIAISNMISRTLKEEQVGVGMGLYSTLGYISGAVSIAVIGRALDHGTTAHKLNPLHGGLHGIVYSNLFLELAGLIVLVAILYAGFTRFSRGL
ncbi:MFS transporter [Cohnella abietis]|uniref:MFS transporter n=1 Tax=Cohnella abietis TaxID=2507935 RepID=A0A3T1D3S3_9BACL|nr:MFS transporter [Cohnella abietis]BBI32744.1 MFS transporter [Cohnella abietis]